MSESLHTHEMQHTRLPCPSLSPWVCSISCPLSQWCHPTISPSVTPFSSRLQSFPASGPFPVSWFFASDGQIIGASSSILLMNIQGWFPLGLTDSILLLSKELARVFSSTMVLNKGCCSHQTIMLQLPDSEGTQDGDKWAAHCQILSLCGHSQLCLKRFRMEKSRILALVN